MRQPPSLSSLRLFVRVANAGSFSAAARSANVSQPALSRTIRLLEEHMGVRLLDRDTRNVRLTPAGETLLPVVERLAGDFDHAFAELSQTLAGRRGRVLIGALPSIAARMLPSALATFISDNPEVEIIVRDDISGALETQLRDGQIDLAVTTPPNQPDEFKFDSFMTDDCVLICRRGDDLDIPDVAHWSVFARHPFIAMAPRSSVRLLTDTAFARANVTVRPLYEVSQLATVGGMIGAGLGVSALPRSTLPMLESIALVSRSLAKPTMVRELGILSPIRRTLSPSAVSFMRHFKGWLEGQEGMHRHKPTE